MYYLDRYLCKKVRVKLHTLPMYEKSTTLPPPSTYMYLVVETYANWLSKVHQKTRGFLEIQFGSG